MKRNVSETNEIDLGLRKVSIQNFSRIVTLPKTFTDNYLDSGMTVRVSMTHDGRLLLTPTRIEGKKKGGKAD